MSTPPSKTPPLPRQPPLLPSRPPMNGRQETVPLPARPPSAVVPLNPTLLPGALGHAYSLPPSYATQQDATLPMLQELLMSSVPLANPTPGISPQQYPLMQQFLQNYLQLAQIQQEHHNQIKQQFIQQSLQPPKLSSAPQNRTNTAQQAPTKLAQIAPRTNGEVMPARKGNCCQKTTSTSTPSIKPLPKGTKRPRVEAEPSPSVLSLHKMLAELPQPPPLPSVVQKRESSSKPGKRLLPKVSKLSNTLRTSKLSTDPPSKRNVLDAAARRRLALDYSIGTGKAFLVELGKGLVTGVLEGIKSGNIKQEWTPSPEWVEANRKKEEEKELKKKQRAKDAQLYRQREKERKQKKEEERRVARAERQKQSIEKCDEEMGDGGAGEGAGEEKKDTGDEAEETSEAGDSAPEEGPDTQDIRRRRYGKKRKLEKGSIVTRKGREETESEADEGSGLDPTPTTHDKKE